MAVSITFHPGRGLASLRTRRRERHVARLVSPRGRRGLAVGLDSVLESADRQSRGFTSQAPLQRREILAQRELIARLADELRSAERIGPRGAEIVERLLTDGTSPLYTPSADGELEATLRHATAALELG